MKKIFITTLVLAGVLLTGTLAFSSEGRLAVSAKAGTIGGGLEGIVKLNDQLNGRLGVSGATLGYEGTESDVDYDFDLNLFTVAGLVDWYPFSGNFRISLGGLYNGNELDASAQPSGTFTIGDTSYTAAQVGSLDGKIDFNQFSPYLGIGWGNPFGGTGNWSFVLDLGVFYQGEANVDLTANGTLSGNAAFLADLDREKNDLEDEITDYKFFPVVTLGVAYKF